MQLGLEANRVFREKEEKHTVDMLEPFFNRFINRTDIWSHQALVWNEKKQIIELQYFRKKPEHDGYRPLDLEHIKVHIDGKRVNDTLSIQALDAEYLCKWACWDFDDGDQGGDDLASFLQSLGLNPVREAARAGRYGHVWIFFAAPVSAFYLCAFDRAVQSYLTLDGVEFFPKQSQKQRDKLLLSNIRLPLGVHHKPGANGARGWFVDAELNITAQLEYINAQPFDDGEIIKQIAQAQLIKEAEQDLRARIAEAHRQADLKKRREELERERGPIEKKYEKMNMLDQVPESNRKLISGWWMTACPACRCEGRDKAGRNLAINGDNGFQFTCFRDGGNGLGHTQLEIVKAIRG